LFHETISSVLAPGEAWERGMRCTMQLGNLSEESCG
jgi:hypothetical protein